MQRTKTAYNTVRQWWQDKICCSLLWKKNIDLPKRIQKSLRWSLGEAGRVIVLYSLTLWHRVFFCLTAEMLRLPWEKALANHCSDLSSVEGTTGFVLKLTKCNCLLHQQSACGERNQV